MRLDKWLKLSRVIKRRTVANEVCDQGRVEINGRPAKASTEVKAGDRLVIRFGSKTSSLTVLSVPEKPVSAQAASELYQLDGEEKEKAES
ncbi:MAG TPA: RNA-binding protein [Cyanobacteria bacterium UBA8530]|nr:RNA-binding protein [Cyanobacteria bacterium UBA8530]